MKCSYHPAVDSKDYCSTCNKTLCPECAHQVKGKVFCQDCIVRGAEWVAAIKDMRIPADSPKRAACCAIIPGMGAVYNNEYLKAVTYFAVFAALIMMGDRVHGVFAFGSVAFLIFTMFEAHRTAEARLRARLESGLPSASTRRDTSTAAWGIFLMVLGTIFLLQSLIPYSFIQRLWPLAFIGLGGYLVYLALKGKRDNTQSARSATPENKGF